MRRVVYANIKITQMLKLSNKDLKPAFTNRSQGAFTDTLGTIEKQKISAKKQSYKKDQMKILELKNI